ncbi:cupin, partial [Nitrosopumilus sp. PRT-SC01]
SYYILEGSGMLKINEDVYQLEKDDSVYVPPNSKQFIENTGSINLRFLCIVEPAWKADNEILLE